MLDGLGRNVYVSRYLIAIYNFDQGLTGAFELPTPSDDLFLPTCTLILSLSIDINAHQHLNWQSLMVSNGTIGIAPPTTTFRTMDGKMIWEAMMKHGGSVAP
jgi:hypothetical protein